MRLFFDTEFLEAGPEHPVRLISIGIVREDGAEYYAETVDAHTLGEDHHTGEPLLGSKIAEHDWLMANVVPSLHNWPSPAPGQGTPVKLRAEIRRDIENFAHTQGRDFPEWWGFCSAYDHVVLNQLFGTMMEHPPRWPFYTNDIAQYAYHLGVSRRAFPQQHMGAHGAAHDALADARWCRDVYLWLRQKEAIIFQESEGDDSTSSH